MLIRLVVTMRSRVLSGNMSGKWREMNAIISIKPQYVEEILAGRKRFEYRKKVFARPVDY